MYPVAPLCLAAALLASAASIPAQTHQTDATSNGQTNRVTAENDKGGKPLPSPRHELQFVHSHNGGATRIVITYGAPSVKGRKIFGGLVPYGHWWRAGANEATSFATDHAIKIGDLTVPAGAYTLDALPQPSGWQLIVNKQTGQWGTEYDPSKDLGHVPMTATPMGTPQETLSYSFDHVTPKTATLHLRWADVDESVQVSYP